MAILEREDSSTQEGWLVWAIELMRRGLKPIDQIIVHGPHSHMPFIWGEAECDTEDGGLYDVEFRTPHVKSIWDVRGVRVRDKIYKEYFSILKVKDMSISWRKEIDLLKTELQEIKKRG